MYKPYHAFKPIFTQMGEFETHFSLATGVLQRDPTRDKRMIEFCQRLPDKQYVYRGVERRLVREYLREYLPPEILADIKHRGLQSADMTDRLARSWEKVYASCNSLIEENITNKLFDTQKIKKKLEEYSKEPAQTEGFEMLKLLYSILLMRYVH
jgi:asparagine synthase (glutamine-hydrolysing)